MKRALGVVVGVGGIFVTLAGCQKKVSQQECDALLDRYAELVVLERFPDASPEQIRAERERERTEARGDDNFKNCTSEVRPTEFACAMEAKNPDAFEKCLE